MSRWRSSVWWSTWQPRTRSACRRRATRCCSAYRCGGWPSRRVRPPLSQCSRSCAHRTVILNLRHDPCAQRQGDKSKRPSLTAGLRAHPPGRLYRNATPSPNPQKGPCAGAWDRDDGRPFVRRNPDAPPGNSMIGLVLVTHGRLAAEFRSALEHVVGPQKQIEAVTIGPDDDVEQRRKDIIEAVKRVDSGEGVAILTDMFGGTPSNLAISVMGRPKVEVLAGINLPMLVKLAKVRDECPLTEAVAAAQDSGRKYITIASRVLTGK